jgi:pimeloyl-ACP methyl ester carboxylesterase
MIAEKGGVPVSSIDAIQDGLAGDEVPWGGEHHVVDLDGPVHYVDFGGPADAPTIVLVHGLGGSYLNWALLGPLLTDRFRVLALDLAGFGLTVPLGRPTTVQANARLLRRFVRHVVDSPVILVGNSMGGMVSVLVATDSPATVRALALLSPTLPRSAGLSTDPAVRRQFMIQLMPFIGEHVLERRMRTVPAAQRVSEMLALVCVDASLVPPAMVEASIRLDGQRADFPGKAAAHLAASRSMLRFLARSRQFAVRLAAITAPVLLMHGRHDRLVPIAAAEAIAAGRPEWTFAPLGSGHVPQLEHPDLVAAELLGWLPQALR